MEGPHHQHLHQEWQEPLEDKGCGAEQVCCSPRCRFGSGKAIEAAEGASSEGKGWRRGGIRLVVSRPGARHALAASGPTEEWLSTGGGAFWVRKGLEELGEGSELVVASIGLTEGKGGRGSGPRTKAWSRWGKEQGGSGR